MVFCCTVCGCAVAPGREVALRVVHLNDVFGNCPSLYVSAPALAEMVALDVSHAQLVCHRRAIFENASIAPDCGRVVCLLPVGDAELP